MARDARQSEDLAAKYKELVDHRAKTWAALRRIVEEIDKDATVDRERLKGIAEAALKLTGFYEAGKR